MNQDDMIEGTTASTDPEIDEAIPELHEVRRLNELAQSLVFADPEEAEKIAKRALAAATQHGSEQDIARSFQIIGNQFWVRGDNRQALNYQKEALQISQEINHKQGIAVSFNNLGTIHTNLGNLDLALKNHTQSLNIMMDLNDKQRIAISYNNIGNIHKIREETDLALKYHHQALDIRTELNEKLGMANSFNNIGNVLECKGDLNTALVYHQKALGLYLNLKEKRRIAGSYNNIAAVYAKMHDYDSALEYHQKSIEIKEEIGDTAGISLALINIGLIHLYKSETDEAERLIRQSLELAIELTNSNLQMECYKALSDIAYHRQEYKDALDNFKLYNSLFENESKISSEKNMADLEMKYEVERRAKEAEFHRMQNESLSREISEHKKTEKKLRESVEKTEIILSTGYAMATCTTLDEVYLLTSDAAERLLKMTMSCLGILEDNVLVSKANSARLDSPLNASVSLDQGLAEETLRMNQSIRYNTVFEASEASHANDEINSGISAPIGDVGVFQVFSEQTDAFSEADSRMLNLLLQFTSDAIQRIRLQKKLQDLEIGDPGD